VVVNKSKLLAIRNSTAEFLIFTSQSGEESIEVKYRDETVWLTQKMMSELFQVTIPTINEHLKNIYESGEISEETTIRKFLIVQTEGKRQVSRSVDFYNLDAIISVGYKVNSVRATQFRRWATKSLETLLLGDMCLIKSAWKTEFFLVKNILKNFLKKLEKYA